MRKLGRGQGTREYTRYTHAHQVPHAEHVERSDEMVKRSRDDVEDFEDVSGTPCCPPPVLFTAQRAKFLMAKITSSCYMVFIALAWHHSNLFMQAHLCCVVCLLRCRAVLCLSRSRAVSERSESLCCWRASLLLSLSCCRLSSLKCLLYLWTRSLAWLHRLSSTSSIIS